MVTHLVGFHMLHEVRINMIFRFHRMDFLKATVNVARITFTFFKVNDLVTDFSFVCFRNRLTIFWQSYIFAFTIFKDNVIADLFIKAISETQPYLMKDQSLPR